MTKKLMFLTILAFCGSFATAQTTKDTMLIKEAIYNYALGWFEGKPDLMEKALYYDFDKRMIALDEQGKTKISGNNAMSMYQKTRSRAEKPIPHDEAIKKIKEVGVFEIYDQIASGYVKSDSWTDFFLLAKVDGDWKMMSVIWQRPKP